MSAFEHGHFREGGKIGIYEMRKDGFISFKADKEGEVMTIPMLYGGGDIELNIDACAVGAGLMSEEDICVIAGTWSINEYISSSPVKKVRL